jgi:hypothetical protein
MASGTMTGTAPQSAAEYSAARNRIEPVAERILDEQFSAIERGLANIDEQILRLLEFRARLLNPQPESIAERNDHPVPVQRTFENRMRTLSTTVYDTCERLAVIINDLERAV